MFQTEESFKEDVPALKNLQIGASCTFYIEIENVENFFNSIKDKVDVVKELFTTWYGMKEFYIRDNNGYILTIAEAKKITMKKSKDEKVQKFLDEIMMFNDEQFDILQKLREIVFKNYPKTNERMMYGGIMFSLEGDFGGIFVRKKHVSFEFVNGFTMNDPDKLLEGSGKFRRHLKIKSLLDINDKKVDFFVQQVV